MRTGMNWNDDGDSHRRDDHRRLNTSDEANLDLLSEMRREMDELMNVVRKKMDCNMDGMVKRMIHPSPRKSWSALCLRSFVFHNLSCSTV